MTPFLRIDNLTLARAGRTVLHGVQLRATKGEIVCLIGPSGSGKSTLLRCVNRLLEPPAATVFIDGADVTSQDVIALRQQAGMLLQQPALFPGTVADNVRYGPGLRKVQLSDREVAALLAQADLPSEMAAQPVENLSGGEAQRVALARALANRPQLLLLDEPTTALDPAATRHIETTLLNLRDRQGLTILWVSHDPQQARRVADRAVLLVQGKVRDEGKPAHIFAARDHHLARLFAAGKLAHTGETSNE